MSYRRAWLLIADMNRCFRHTVVDAKPGGSQGGGAVLTEFGAELVRDYRAIETGAAAPRASTLINIARALGMEMMLIPKEMTPAVQAMLRSGGDDQPAFTADPDEDSE